MKKIISVILTSSFVAGLASVPTFADGSEMTVSAPKYYRVIATKDADGYDAYEQVEDFADGKFSKIVSWNDSGSVTGSVTGTFKTEVDVANGAEKNVTLYGATYEGGKLANVESDKKVTADAADKLSATVNVAEGQTFKNFIWDVEGGMKPVAVQDKAPSIRYFYCDDPNTVTVAWYNEGGSYTLEKNGVAVDISGIPTIGAGSESGNMGKYSVYVYTDASAQTGDKYVVKNNGVASDELVADFTEGAYVTLGEYLVGRNMAYLRNDNAQWWHETVSDHININGVECDAAAYKVYEVSTGTKQKWTSFFFKVDQDYISGEGNTVDITIDYFDYGTGTLRIKNAGASSESDIITVAQLEDTKTWKTATYRLTDASFLADTCISGEYQLRVMTGTGSAIGKVSVTPYEDTTVKTLRAANTYIDGVELRWTVGSSKGITGYTVKRNGEVIATNYQNRTYFDRNLAADTTYTYTVTPELAEGAGTESEALTVTTAKKGEASMTLPLGVTADYTEATEYTENGLTFALLNNNRWRDALTVEKEYGGKKCRSTVARTTKSSGQQNNWYSTYSWGSDKSYLRSSFLTFRVDNNVISADTRNVTLEFDYYDIADGTIFNGIDLVLEYRAYDPATGASKAGSKSIINCGSTNTWKNLKVELTDACFDHAGDFNGFKWDFALRHGANRGGVAMTNIKVYETASSTMPENEISAVINADGTAFEGDLTLSNWNSYDRHIGYSGNNDDSLTAVDGKHYTFNERYDYPAGKAWAEWKNAWYFSIPDDFLYGTDYENVKIVVEYYLPKDDIGFRIYAKNTNGGEYSAWASNGKFKWVTDVFEFKPGDGNNVTFANGFSEDFKIECNGQGYIHKVTVIKDFIED